MMGMGKDMVIAILSLIGTMLGTFGGIITSSKLSNYRIEQLEKKVDKHNGFGGKIRVIQEQNKGSNHKNEGQEKHKVETKLKTGRQEQRLQICVPLGRGHRRRSVCTAQVR